MRTFALFLVLIAIAASQPHQALAFILKLTKRVDLRDAHIGVAYDIRRIGF